MNLKAIQKAEARLLVPTYDRYPVLMTKGEGVHLYDADGRKHLDFLSGIGVNALGYNHPAIRKALTAQAAKLIHVSNLFFNEYQGALAAKLTKLAGLDRGFFCNSGAEAWEGALKLARAYGQHTAGKRKPKWRILATENSFHGRTYGALSTTGQAKYRKAYEPVLPGIVFAKFNDVADLEAKFDDSVCAIVFETIQGEGGVQPVSREFLRAARKLADRSGALLVLDEIQCGLGRTGKMFAYQHYGITPDIVTVAKPLAAGIPLGALLTTDKVSAAFKPGMHGTTFGGGPLACAVALAFLETIEKKKLLKHVQQIGEYLRERLNELDARHPEIQDVRGIGLMVAVELSDGELAKTVVRRMLESGIIINRTHENTLRFLPPYIITRRDVDAMVKALDKVLFECSRS